MVLWTQTRRRLAFRRIWDFHNRYKAAIIVISTIIDHAIFFYSHKWCKKHLASNLEWVTWCAYSLRVWCEHTTSPLQPVGVLRYVYTYWKYSSLSMYYSIPCTELLCVWNVILKLEVHPSKSVSTSNLFPQLLQHYKLQCCTNIDKLKPLANLCLIKAWFVFRVFRVVLFIYKKKKSDSILLFKFVQIRFFC